MARDKEARVSLLDKAEEGASVILWDTVGTWKEEGREEESPSLHWLTWVFALAGRRFCR